MLLLGFLLAMGIGAALGAIGSGGSILALPLLVYVLHVSPSDAVPMSLIIVGSASAGAAVLKWRQGDMHWKALGLLASTGAVGAYLGAEVTHAVPPVVLMTLFASILLAVGLLMLTEVANRLKPRQCHIARCLIAGAIVGLLTGFLGVGGGFLLVPTLVLFAGLALRRALGPSVGIISINALAGILGQLRFMRVDWGVTGLLVAATLAGMGIGITI